MKLMLKISIIILLCVFAINTHAQVPATVDGVTISKSSDSPRPGELFDVSVESYNFDLNSASMVWLINGKLETQGVGIKKITVTAPALGKKMIVSVAIKTADGKEIKKNIEIRSGAVEIIVETKGYEPAFFKGKLPFVYQNSIKLIAIPHLSKDGINELDPKTLVYTWKLGGKYIAEGQGYGVQSVDIRAGEIPKPLDITIEVHNREQNQSANSGITLEPTEPTLSFYEDNALYGLLLNKTLQNRVSLTNNEIKIRAVPYGFNYVQNKDSSSYTWSINDIYQPDLIKNQSIVLRTKTDTEGSSNIALDIRNEDNILQGAIGNLTIFFTKKLTENQNNTTF